MSRRPNSDSYNRIFILGARTATPEDLQCTFERFGVIKDVRVLKDRITRENKGISYITFEKASEAALAIETMNGQFICGLDKPIKVLLANDRSEGNVRDPEEEDKMKRLFIIVPNEQVENDLRTHFKTFGELEYVKMLPKNAKGLQLAYVKFYSAYHAALALEQCDQVYKAKFAETTWTAKRMKQEPYKRDHSPHKDGDLAFGKRYKEDQESSGHRSRDGRFRGGHTFIAKMIPNLSPGQVYKLFDLQPGLESCDYSPTTGLAQITYSDYPFAERAKEILKTFEYPPGSLIQFTDSRSTEFRADGTIGKNLNVGPPMEKSFQAPLQMMEKVHGVPANYSFGDDYPSHVTDSFQGRSEGQWNLQNHPEAPGMEQVQFVSFPEPIPIDVLTNAFYRFQNFLKVEYVPGSNSGVALFSSHESAVQASESLNGQKMFGNELKIIGVPNSSGGGVAF